MKYNNYYLTNDKTIEIYKNKNLSNLFNDINNKTTKDISLLENIFNEKIFKVPSFKKKLSWGYETIFLPFTNKLFKIIETKYNATSLQLHPIKNETWYPLKNVTINDGLKDIKIEHDTIIDIPRKSTHSLCKGATIFEVQDNIPFQYDETYRIYDASNRTVHPSIFNAYHFLKKDNIKLIDDNLSIKPHTLLNDSFIFSKDDDVTVEADKKVSKLKKQELWFLSKGTKILNNLNNVIIVKAEYIKGE